MDRENLQDGEGVDKGCAGRGTQADLVQRTRDENDLPCGDVHRTAHTRCSPNRAERTQLCSLGQPSLLVPQVPLQELH